jgi:ABC-type multidrug transport system fused ATPase/permease subunit
VGILVRQRAGGLTHLLTGELQRVPDSVSLGLSLINVGCMTLLYFVIALKLSAKMTLLVTAMGGALMLLQRRSLERMRKSGEELYKSVGEVFNRRWLPTPCCAAEESRARWCMGCLDRRRSD